MSFVFSDHARFQIKKRKIPEELVIRTVQKPEEVLSSFWERKLRRVHIGDRILEVVTKTEGPRITIITAYYL